MHPPINGSAFHGCVNCDRNSQAIVLHEGKILSVCIISVLIRAFSILRYTKLRHTLVV